MTITARNIHATVDADVQQDVCLAQMLHDVLDGLERIRVGESGCSPDEVRARMQHTLEMACQMQV